MQKRTKSKSHLPDVLVVVLCLLVALYFVLLFWRDLNSSSKRSDKTQIATISFKDRIAQRKFNDRVVWERLSQNSPLYEEDIILTADLSKATIQFNDGTVLDIYENTMIQLYTPEEGGYGISVSGGTVTLEASDTSAVTLKLDDGSVVNVDAGASISAVSDANGAKSVDVRSGSASVTAESGETASLVSGESLSVQSDGQLQKKLLTVTSIPSELRILNLYGEAMSVPLEWKVSGDGGQPEIRIQTSARRDFSDLRSDRLAESNPEVLELPDGITWWKIFAEDSGEESAVTGRITVENVLPPEQLSPAANGEVAYRATPPKIQFRWTGNEFADHYRLSLAAAPDMRTGLQELEVRGTSVILDNLEEGTYWWQISPHYALNSLGYAGESSISSFTVIKNPRIKPPQLSVPADNAQITYRKTAELNFMWKSELKDAGYDLLISHDPDFSDTLYSHQTTDMRAALTFDGEDVEGTYYWKIVRNSDETEDLDFESDVRTFTLVKYVPGTNRLLYPADSFVTEIPKLPSVRFMWRLADDYKGQPSVFQLSTEQDFSVIRLEQELAAPSTENLLLAEGTYFWRVGVRDEDGSAEGFTAPNSFTVLKELAAPQITAPVSGSTSLAFEGSEVLVSWNEVPGADYYNLRVFDKENHVVAENPAVTGTSFRTSLPAGAYLCRVQAVQAETENSALRTSTVSSVEFSLRDAERIRLTAPEDKASVPGLTAVRRATVFSWAEGQDKAASYVLVLKKRQNDGSYKVVERIPDQKNSAAVERLSAGTYTWQVLASTADGIPLDSAEQTLVIEKIPELPKAQLSTPSRNLTMNSDYLRKNRSITFEWKAVEGANSYNLTLYRQEKNGSLRTVWSEKNIKATRARLKDLSILDTGDFVWSVTAFSYAKDGFEEQRSAASESNFKISFAAPSDIQAETPGRMYSE